jgi:protoporphyrinogen oxidase
MTSDKKKWGVVGGGIMGMTVALRLAQRGESVTLLESFSSLGGLASPYHMGDITWDRFYHVILMSDSFTRKILSEIGLENKIRWVETKTGFYTSGKLYSLSNTIEFLKFPPLGLIDKFRLGITIFYASKIKNWRKLERISVEKWLVKWSGRRTYEKIWLPLLKAKLGDSYSIASAAFIWTTIQRMYAARKSGLKKEMFGYVPGGYSKIIEKFEQKLRESGVNILLNQKVKRISQNNNGNLVIEKEQDENLVFDKLVLTIPSTDALTLCEGISEQEKLLHRNIQYLGVICPAVLLRKAISHYYVTNITDTWVPFTGIIEMSALVDPKEFKGNHLVYLPRYVKPDDPYFDKTDEQIRQEFIDALKRMYPQFNEEDIVFWETSRARKVFALSTRNYSENLPTVKTSVPGLFILNSAQIVNGTLNVNETIQVAERNLGVLLKE